MPDTRGGALWRFLLASVLVVLFTAATTAVGGLLQVKQLVKLIDATPPLPEAHVTIAQAGDPQTLLLVGSDHRAGEPYKNSNTDTMMLVRLNASSSTINVLSIPRDLKVLLPEGGVQVPGRLNAAYSLGGTSLLVKVLQAQVFHGLVINHIIDVNFGGFQALVNAVGCVYADSDRRYYHVSAPDPADNWSSIDIQPGYQKMCGSDALAFVRFRHFDSDIVRNARQQDFLRWAKSQFSTSTLINQQEKLTSIFGHHAQTDKDLHSVDGLLKLFDLIAFSAGHAVRQITFPAILLPCNAAAGGQTPCYVTADPGAEQAAYQQFMTATIAHPAAPNPHPPGPGKPHHGGAPPFVPVFSDLPDAKAQATDLGNVGMPVYVPGKIALGSVFCTPGNCEDGLPGDGAYPRRYRIQDQSGQWHAAYVMTLVKNQLLGQFYSVQGLDWQNPPILTGPHQTQMVNGKQLFIYNNGGKVTLVAWHGPHGVYWVANTLTDDLSQAQMVAIAASLTPA